MQDTKSAETRQYKIILRTDSPKEFMEAIETMKEVGLISEIKIKNVNPEQHWMLRAFGITQAVEKLDRML